jgi:lysozyme
MRITEVGLDLIKKYESLCLTAYLCPANKWTIGWGHTGPDVVPGKHITAAEAHELLRKDVERFEREVTGLLDGKPTKQCQFDALVVLAFNIGSDIDDDRIPEGLGDSTLLRKHLSGDYAGAAAEFAKWDKARVRGQLRSLNGLKKRREQEARLYRGVFA